MPAPERTTWWAGRQADRRSTAPIPSLALPPMAPTPALPRRPSPNIGGGIKGRGCHQRRLDSRQHRHQIADHFIVPKAQHAPPVLLQDLRSRGILRGPFRMHVPIDLDRQSPRRTGEVDHERPDGVLAPDVQPRKLVPPRRRPELVRGRCHLVSKQSRRRNEVRGSATDPTIAWHAAPPAPSFDPSPKLGQGRRASAGVGANAGEQAHSAGPV